MGGGVGIVAGGGVVSGRRDEPLCLRWKEGTGFVFDLWCVWVGWERTGEMCAAPKLVRACHT